MSKKQQQLEADLKYATGYYGAKRSGHGFGGRYDLPNKVHDMHQRNLERLPDISHSFGKRTCAKCKTPKAVKGGRKFGAKFVCADCAPAR